VTAAIGRPEASIAAVPLTAWIIVEEKPDPDDAM